MAFLKRAHREAMGRGARFPLLLAALVVGTLATGDVEAQAAAGEYQVKAAYLLNFARFVEWPPDVLRPGAPLNMAIVGDDPFGAALEEALRGQSANGHPIQLRHQRWDDSLTSYEIVFVSSSEESHLSEILRFLGQRSVLTVSDIDRFALRGGVIEFRMVGNRVRFDINRANGTAARLTISSKLLNVARSVHDGGIR